MTMRSSKQKWLSVAASLVALGAVLAIVETVHPVFKMPEEFNEMPAELPPELVVRFEAAFTKMETQNAVFVAAIAGGVLALVLSLSECCCRQSWSKAIGFSILGLLLGLACGAGGGWGGRYLLLNATESNRDLTGILMSHVAMLAMIGLGAGLARGLVAGGLKTSVVSAFGGMLCGGVAATCYVMCMSTLLPSEKVEFLVGNKTVPRSIWFALTGFLVPVGVVFAEHVGPRTESGPVELAVEQPDT